MTFLTADVPATIENMKDISSTEDLKDIAETATTDIKTGAFQKWIEGMMPSALSFFWSVVIALIAWFIGVRIIHLVRGIVRRSFIRHEVEEGVRTFVDSLLRIVLYLSLIIVILNIFGFETTSVSAAVASLGVTIGLAMQGSLSNFAGGVLILVLHPFRVGDYIVEDSHGNEGTVQSISIFYTKLVTLDNRVVVIPNGTLANSSLTNVTECDFRMIDLTVGIAYSADLRKAKHTQIGYDTHGEYQHDLGRYVTCQLQYDSDIHRYGTEAEVVDAKAGEYPAGQGEVDTVEPKTPQEELRHSHH